VTRSAAEEDRLLEQLLQRYFEAAEQGTPPPLHELCSDCPDLLPAVAAMLGDEPTNAAESRPARVEDPLLGNVLGDRYRMLDRLGAGGMGLVYLARDETLDREVAVKVLEDIFQGIPERIERFRREAKALAALENPHIVAVHDFDLQASPPYLVMDRIRGFDLGHFLAELRRIAAPGRMPERFEIQAAAAALGGVDANELGPLFDASWAELVARLAEQMCNALAQAHAAGIVHRDIKPSNFMLDTEGRLRLLDFGLARREVDEGLTRTEASVGTPIYMSPEQVEGKDATARSDIYSLGATLYQCLTLQQPFEGRGRDLQNHILYEEPTPPRQIRARVPADLQAICLTAMHKDPARRYGSVRDLGDEVQRFLAYEPVLARPRILPAPLRSFVATWRRYRPPKAMLAGGLTVVLVVIGLASGWLGRVWGSEEVARRAEYEQLRPRISPTLALGGTREERLQAKNRTRQLEILDRLLELEPTDVEARFLRYYAHQEDPKLADGAVAKADLAALKAAIPEAVLSALQRAFELLRDRRSYARGKVAAADAAWKVLEPLPEATGSLAALISRLRITAANESARFAKASKLAVATVNRTGATAFTRFEQALALLGLKRNSTDIIGLLDAVHALCPEHAQTLQLTASYYHRARKLDAAEKAIVAALRLLPNHTSFLSRQAEILRDQGRFAEAELALRKYPESKTDERDFELALLRAVEGRNLYGTGRPEVLDKSMRLFGESKRILSRLAEKSDAELGVLARKVRFMLRTVDAWIANNKSQLEQLLLREYRENPLNVLTLSNLGELYIKARSRDKREEGRRMLRLASTLDPSRGRAVYSLAWSYRKDAPEQGLEVFHDYRAGQPPGEEDRLLIEELLGALPAAKHEEWRRRLVRDELLPELAKNR